MSSLTNQLSPTHHGQAEIMISNLKLSKSFDTLIEIDDELLLCKQSDIYNGVFGNDLCDYDILIKNDNGLLMQPNEQVNYSVAYFDDLYERDAARPMTMPFGGYNTWRADNSSTSDGTVEDGSALVYFNNNSEAYVAYFMSATEVYLVKFATTTQGMAYILTKMQ